VSIPLLVEYYSEMPERRLKEDASSWRARLQVATETFRQRVEARYTEGTLLRLLDSPSSQVRQAALVALGLVGTMAGNRTVAARLHDESPEVRKLAVDTLWSLWFRADSEANNRELQKLMRMRDRERALGGLNDLLLRAPAFAEAYNQRAILLYRMKEFERSIVDCEKALQLNPVHFGARHGMAQSYLQMRKNKAALKAFRDALRIYPHMEGVADTVRALETALGEEGRRDDKK
jgi:tetratricopeptide (TPR) repeat protein